MAKIDPDLGPEPRAGQGGRERVETRVLTGGSARGTALRARIPGRRFTRARALK